MFRFIANDECCESCASKDGKKSKKGKFGEYELPHPNCRCRWMELFETKKKDK